MCILKISKTEIPINEIENFIDDIYKNHNVQNSFQGNVIIAITEMVSVVTNLGGEGTLIFQNLKKEFSFKYEIHSLPATIHSLFSKNTMNLKMDSDYEKSIFLIMGLCDDFKIDEKTSSISITFKKDVIGKEITSHRKEYLENYLGKTIESLT